MPIALVRLRSFWPAAFLAAATILLVLPPLPSQAQTAKPAKKDSSPRTKPKDVVVTASVSQTEAKPGDTLSYKVTAKLKPGWHIYTYAKQQEGEGPRNTKFDFFETGGLKIEGEWIASKESIRKKEPAFPDLEFVAFYEDEVTWSIALKVPSDAASGKKLLRCQASYQICDAMSCSFPGQWTLPDVELTIVGGDQAKGPAAAVPTVAAPQPKRKDSPARLRSDHAKLEYTVKPTEAKPGDTVTLSVTAKLDLGWHIYDYAKEQPAGGPWSTKFDLFDLSDLTVAGDWISDLPADVKVDPNFNNMKVASFENEVTWSIPLKVPTTATEGTKPLRCQISFQICDASVCLPQVFWTLPDVALKVVNGSTQAATGAPNRAAKPAETVVAAATASKPDATEKPAATESNASPVSPASAELAADSAPKVVSEVQRAAQQGIMPLMIASAIGGLAALVMPCVWPMVPITVNFFVKQGEKGKDKKKTTGLAITYCLAIIGVFTSVGLLCSVFVSATALATLANNGWLNLGVAVMFFAFGLSLLGLFEIRLPNSFLNASAKGEGRGGLVGVFFMALTLTITSFTCTFPVVGGLLVMAAGGQFYYPIIGLATFSTVLALPFFLLALSPGMLSKVPKSGDWMNAVKVVGGLVEIGAAFKFLNTAELSSVTPEQAWINAPFMLTAWVVLAAVCGFYLLGFFRTDHDHEEVKVGPGRMVLGSCFLGFALFLAPALFGRPPQSKIWDELVVGFLPPDVANLAHASGGGGGTAGGQPNEVAVHATDPDPDKAQRQERRFHGVWWDFSYEQALEKAKAENKPILIDFTGVNCANCRAMEAGVLPKPEVVDVLKRFITIQLYTDRVPINSISADDRVKLAEKNINLELDLTNDSANPFYVVLGPDGKLLGAKGGKRSIDEFVAFLNDSLGKWKGAGSVAQADAVR